MKRKLVLTSIILILLTFLSSCGLTPMEEGRSVNEYIFPYVNFTLSDDGSYYTAEVVEGAALRNVTIPADADYFGDGIPVLRFNGFVNGSDAKNLEAITFESSQTSFSSDLFIYAGNLKTFTIGTIDSQYSYYSDLAVIEKPGFEFDGWYIEGTRIMRKNGDRIIAGHTVLEPRWKEHDLKYIERKEAACTSDGNIAYYKCSSCNRFYLDESALEEVTSSDITIAASHKLEHFDKKAPTCLESGNIEYYKCSVCSRLFTDSNAQNEITSAVLAPLEHKLFPVDGKDAGCIEGGVSAHYECENCHSLFLDKDGKNVTTSEELVIPPTGHKWVRKQYSEENSCTWDECENCGETQNAAGHTWNDGEITKEATTEESGTKLFTCTVCKHTKEEDIPPLGDHTWFDAGTKEATCTEREYTLKRCSTCSIEYKSDYVDATGHRNEYVPAEDKTCLEDGNTAYYVCSLCGGLFKDRNGINKTTLEEVQKDRKARGYHEWGTVWQSDETSHWLECKDCGTLSEKVEHNYKETNVDTSHILSSATCTAKAVYYYSCECGRKSTKTFEYGNSLGHIIEEHKEEASTCEKQGHITYYTCSRSCCSGRYYLDKDLTEFTTKEDNLLLPYAHVFEKNQYSKGTDGKHHYRICDKCGKAVESTEEKHEFTWKHTDYVHWEECTVCGYKKGTEESHTLEGTPGKRLCNTCGFSEEKAEDSKSGGFDVIEIDRKPHGYLKTEKSGTDWTFTLISTNDENAKIEAYIWSVNGKEVECSSNVYTLSAPDKHSYRIMCVFRANGYFSSDTVTITGGE